MNGTFWPWPGLCAVLIGLVTAGIIYLIGGYLQTENISPLLE